MVDFRSYTQGLHRISDGSYAYTQPDGSWGLNNTGLLVNKGQALLIDTTMDLQLTHLMLSEMAKAESAARRIGTVILTHWHVDHVHGIGVEELRNSRIVSSQICAEYMDDVPPPRFRSIIGSLEGDAKRMMNELLGKKGFDFNDIVFRPPTDTFENHLELVIGDRKVIVVEARPCHTRSDSVVFIPEEGVVHTGDLVAGDRHVGVQYPFMSNLIKICELMLSWDAKVYIPGHGPLLSASDLRRILEYLQFMQSAARERYDAGKSPEQATDEILAGLGPYKSLRGASNLFFTVKMLFCEFAGNTEDYVRRNYTEYLTTQWRLHNEIPARFPELFTTDPNRSVRHN